MRIALALLLLVPSVARSQQLDGLPAATQPLAAANIMVVCQGGTPGLVGTCTPGQAPVSALLGSGSSIITLQALTIATLPTCGVSTVGEYAYVTNGAASPAYNGTVSATGTVTVPVFCNGTNWTYH